VAFVGAEEFSEIYITLQRQRDTERERKKERDRERQRENQVKLMNFQAKIVSC